MLILNLLEQHLKSTIQSTKNLLTLLDSRMTLNCLIMIENDEIVSYKADSLLNKRNELVGTCKHILVYKLVNFDPTG